MISYSLCWGDVRHPTVLLVQRPSRCDLSQYTSGSGGGKMWRKMVDYVVGNGGENQRDLAWSLQPILQCVRFYGIELNVSMERLNFRRYASTASAFIIWVIMESSFYFDLNEFPSLYKSGHKSTKLNSTRAWLNFILNCHWFLWDFLFPMVIFWTYTVKWKELWKKARKLQKLMNYEISFHKQLRLYTLIITVFSITAVS